MEREDEAVGANRVVESDDALIAHGGAERLDGGGMRIDAVSFADVEFDTGYTLTKRYILLNDNNVELGDRVKFQCEFSLLAFSGPIGMLGCIGNVVSLMATNVVAFGFGTQCKVFGEDTVSFGPESHQHGAILSGYATCRVGRHIEKQQSIAPHTVEVDVHQFVDRLGMLLRVPEPARTDANVAFGWNPL